MATGGVFISYRRGEDSGVAGRLHDRLERRFGRERLFFDVDSIPLGEDFHTYLDQQVAQCGVFVVVIGRGWHSTIGRLGDEGDFVRIEVAAALRRDRIRIIPVLLDGAAMPRAEQLPEPIRGLTRRNALTISHEHFASVVDGRLARAIDDALGRAAAAAGQPPIALGDAPGASVTAPAKEPLVDEAPPAAATPVGGGPTVAKAVVERPGGPAATDETSEPSGADAPPKDRAGPPPQGASERQGPAWAAHPEAASGKVATKPHVSVRREAGGVGKPSGPVAKPATAAGPGVDGGAAKGAAQPAPPAAPFVLRADKQSDPARDALSRFAKKYRGAAQDDAPTARLAFPLRGHAGGVRSVAFSPSGARVATGSNDRTARVWDAATGREIARLDRHEGAVTSVAFSLDGGRLATGSDDRTARLRDTATGREIVRLDGHEGAVTSIAFSPDGARLATGSDDGSARLWDAVKGRKIARLDGHYGRVNGVTFSPDGARLATGSDDRTARLWDAAAGCEIARLGKHQGLLTSIAFSPDGARLAVGSDDRAGRIWDVATGREIARLDGHEGRVRSVAFSPDGSRLCTGSDDRTARIWDAATGREIARLDGHEDWVRSVAFSPDGARLATGSDDRTALIWTIADVLAAPPS